MSNIEKDLQSSEALAYAAAEYLLEKKAKNVKLFDVQAEQGITDFYVNASATSKGQAAALAELLEEKLREWGRTPLHVEGRTCQDWILVDYGDVIVNIFDRPTRDFYDLDRKLPAEGQRDLTHIIEKLDKKYSVD